MRVLVTGASGFLGSALMGAFAESNFSNLEVVPWMRDGMGDLRSRVNRISTLRDLRPDYVVHLAWEATGREHYDSGTEHEIWRTTTTEFAKECTKEGIRVAVAGSAADIPGDSSYDSPYSDAKRAIRVELQREIEEGAVVWLRPQYVVSIAEFRPRVVREFLTQWNSSQFRLRNPDAAFDFVEVRDVAAAMMAAVQFGLVGVVELGSGELHSVQQLIAGVGNQLGNEGNGLCSGEEHRAGMDMSRLRAVGWQPRFTNELMHGASVSMSP